MRSWQIARLRKSAGASRTALDSTGRLLKLRSESTKHSNCCRCIGMNTGVREGRGPRGGGRSRRRGPEKMPKTAEELKGELVRATLNMWIELVREKGYENTDLGDAIDTLLRKNPEFF